MRILTVDDAIEEFSISELTAFKPRQRKEAYQDEQAGSTVYISTDYDQSTTAEARLDFGEEILFAAVCAGKIRLLARDVRQRSKNSLEIERVELFEVATADVRESTLERVDGEMILILPQRKEEEDAREVVDLHIYESEFDVFFEDVRAFRRLQVCLDYGLSSYQKPDAEVLPFTPPTAGAEHEFTRWFQSRVETAGANKFAGKNAVWLEAKGLFGRLSYRGFLRVWGLYAPPEWRRAGRRPMAES